MQLSYQIQHHKTVNSMKRLASHVELNALCSTSITTLSRLRSLLLFVICKHLIQFYNLSTQVHYLGFDAASCAAWSFCAASWSAIVIDVNFLPIRSCISRYFATQRSRHTASPLLSSDSLYFGGTHFFWQAADILQ